MKGIGILIYILIFIIVGLIGYAIVQIKTFGMNVKDFWSFIEANQTLDRLYAFSKKYEKYNTVLEKYKDIKMLRWANN